MDMDMLITHKYMNHNDDTKQYVELEIKWTKSVNSMQSKPKINIINNICGVNNNISNTIDEIATDEIVNTHGKYHSLYGSTSQLHLV